LPLSPLFPYTPLFRSSDAQQLEVPAGAAAFHIERLGLSGARTLEWRTTVVRGDRFRVSSQFSPSAGFRWGFDTHAAGDAPDRPRSEEHTSELQSRFDL